MAVHKFLGYNFHLTCSSYWVLETVKLYCRSVYNVPRLRNNTGVSVGFETWQSSRVISITNNSFTKVDRGVTYYESFINS